MLIVWMNLDRYEYRDEDIVIMLDGGAVEDSQLAPTRENIVSKDPWCLFMGFLNVTQ